MATDDERWRCESRSSCSSRIGSDGVVIVTAIRFWSNRTTITKTEMESSSMSETYAVQRITTMETTTSSRERKDNITLFSILKVYP